MKRLLFLTSTVRPALPNYVGDVDGRIREYISAINYYITNTDYKILVIDNSGYDFHQVVPRSNRFEALFFTEDVDNAARGKGYGESRILDYGFSHSLFINDASQIIKITGRHIIKNINSLLRFCSGDKIVYVDSNINFTYAHSYFFVAPKSFYTNFLFPHQEEMNDSKGVHMEHVLAKSLREWKSLGYKYRQFVLPIYIIGHPGTTKIAYRKPSLDRYIKILVKYIMTRIFRL